jgi:N-acetylneuraminic acid mutarotase
MRFALALLLSLPVLADVTSHSTEPASPLMIHDNNGDACLYNPSQNHWDRFPGGEKHGRYAITICCDRKMFTWGGSGIEKEETILYFDSNTRRWDKMDAPPLELREAFAASVQGRRVALWGGTQTWGKYFADGAIYDFSKKRWEKIPEAPIEGRAWCGMTWMGSRLVVWGGYGTNQQGYADGAIYHVTNRTWTKLPDLDMARRGAPVVLPLRDKLFIWGGRGLEGVLMDPSTGKTETLPPAPIGSRGFSAAAVSGSKVYVFGGYGEAGSHKSDSAVFDLATRKWTPLPESTLSVRYNATAVECGGRIYVFGGLGQGESFPKDGAYYDPRTRQWQKIAEINVSAQIARTYYR